MRTLNTAAALLAAGLLVGCATTPDTEPHNPERTPEPAQSTPTQKDDPSPEQEAPATPDETLEEEPPRPVDDQAEVDDDGNVVKQVGESAELSTPDGSQLYEVTITNLYEIADCETRVGGQSLTPAGDTFLVAEIEASVSDDIVAITGMTEEEAFLPLVHEAFHVTTTSGETFEGVHGNYFGCLTEDELIQPFIGPGEADEGLLVLDVAGEPDTVTYDPDNTGGWSWKYDQ